MSTNLYFVRHAHSTYTPDEIGRPLSERGFIDAKTVTELLKTGNIDEVYSSPYKRTIQTVQGIAEYIDKEIIIGSDFKERVLSETPVEDFATAISNFWENFDFYWKGGESNTVAQNRGIRAVRKLLKKHNGKNIVIGIHGNLMVLIMNYFNNNYGFDFWMGLEMPDIYRLSFEGKELIGVNRICRDIGCV
ncbi:histidine phosphatase family protein [Virgibacillus dakarensis]|uniref:Phosphoglycerate mutase n=1 Tax=Lentibacillus populi TaxID=1827502 RepID=A0A9W5X7L8_9BACI|nr:MULTISPECIES: histidine phosphatase family protein [Bacillaceae]MTW87153.1 histidine phosphatase family protein [Virgibacillus dakarensis]GGB60875.1 phosphoglycerate mutase [Lentibacillus populi]